MDKAADFAECKATGRFGIIFGLQSSAQFENVDAVDACYAAGQRISQLCHNFRSAVADGAFEPRDAGISEFGAKVIERMNALGMAVDLGHASERTRLEACELSKAPLILAHGNCRALNPESLRASTDEAIRALARRGGVMGIACIAFMVKENEPVSVDNVIDHIDYVRNLVGIEHVGIGSDAGIESNDLGEPQVLKEMLSKADPRYRVHGTHEIVAGLEGPNRFQELTAALIRRKYTDEHIRLVLRGGIGSACYGKFGEPDVRRRPVPPALRPPAPGRAVDATAHWRTFRGQAGGAGWKLPVDRSPKVFCGTVMAHLLPQNRTQWRVSPQVSG